eukprot:TRINITY_DN9358_c0_g1_i5.p2 TRINITY_DN9358_c0_g1~~TRINITY_DN9358_c0_g1_i5.p2  ORF type:complete len:149 (+),score=58.05 TRINITY_DN9358_c0_g1_i5:118-564(+)
MDIEDIKNFKYKVSHVFNYHFQKVAEALWSKYKNGNAYSTITIADIKQIDENKFVFVRRMDRRGEVAYEKIVYNRRQPKIVADLYVNNDKTKARDVCERCVYTYDSLKGSVNYNLIVIKEMWTKFIRVKLSEWGIGQMERLLKAAPSI